MGCWWRDGSGGSRYPSERVVSKVRTRVEVLKVGSRGGFWIYLMPELAAFAFSFAVGMRETEDSTHQGFWLERWNFRLLDRENCRV